MEYWHKAQTYLSCRILGITNIWQVMRLGEVESEQLK